MLDRVEINNSYLLSYSLIALVIIRIDNINKTATKDEEFG